HFSLLHFSKSHICSFPTCFSQKGLFHNKMFSFIFKFNRLILYRSFSFLHLFSTIFKNVFELQRDFVNTKEKTSIQLSRFASTHKFFFTPSKVFKASSQLLSLRPYSTGSFL